MQRRQDRRKLHLALTRPAPVRIIELDMANQAGRQPAVNQFSHRLRFSQSGSAAVDHGAQIGVIDAAHQGGGLGYRIDQLGFIFRQGFDAIEHVMGRRRQRHLRQAVLQSRQRNGMALPTG